MVNDETPGGNTKLVIEFLTPSDNVPASFWRKVGV
jgi:hypothetical protein